MANSGHVQAAIADLELANAVAAHKSMFFAEKDASKNSIDYRAAVCGEIQIIADGSVLAAIEKDYVAMLEDGLLSIHQPSFAEIITICSELQSSINRSRLELPNLQVCHGFLCQVVSRGLTLVLSH